MKIINGLGKMRKGDINRINTQDFVYTNVGGNSKRHTSRFKQIWKK